MTMHEVEPFTHEFWICTKCGNLFNRVPECHGCKEDPMMQGHTCEVESAIIEGDCQEDPILVDLGEWEAEGGA